MKDNRKEFIFVIGKSEGMNADAMLEGFNSLVEKQKKIKDESTFTLVFFNDECKASYVAKSFKSLKKYNQKTYVPKGGSALFDAIGYSMTTVGEKLAETSEEERPSIVSMIIIGEEDNRSTIYDPEVLQGMINEQKYIYKWDFVLYTDGETRFDINKGGNLSDVKKMFNDINNYMTSLR